MSQILRSRILVFVALFAAGIGTVHAQTAETWGNNENGQLGNGTTTNSSKPVTVKNLNGVTLVTVGAEHSLAVQNGAVYAWGYNGYGQLGNGTTTNSSTPIAVSILTSNVTAISAGVDHSLAIQNGAVYNWGDSTTSNNIMPVLVSGLANGVTAIAAGSEYNLAVQNGAVYAWGNNISGQLGNGTTTNSDNPVAVSSLPSGVSTVSAGKYHSIAIRNGAVYAWGMNNSGELGDGTTTNSTTPVDVSGLTGGVTAVATGGDHSLALKDGNVYAWGNNYRGQLGNNTQTSSSVAIEIDPSDLRNIVAVTAGESSSYAVSADGSLWVWGLNSSGELGLGTSTVLYTTPQHLLPPSGYAFTAISGQAAGSTAIATLSPILPKIANVSRSVSGHFVLQASSGTPNITYTILASPDLSTNSFTKIGTATANATGALQYDDAGAVGLSQRFYRVTYP